MICIGNFKKKASLFGEVGYSYNPLTAANVISDNYSYYYDEYGNLITDYTTTNTFDSNSAVFGIGYGNFRSNIDLKCIYGFGNTLQLELMYRLGF